MTVEVLQADVAPARPLAIWVGVPRLQNGGVGFHAVLLGPLVADCVFCHHKGPDRIGP